MRKLVMERTEVFCKSLSQNREKHGTEKVMGVHINFRCELTPKILDCLVYGLPQSFDQILFTEKEHQKRSGFSDMKFDTVFQNYIIVLNYSALDDEGKMDQRFTEVTIYKFAAVPKDGGLVEVEFQVKINPSDEQLVWLALGFKHEIWKLEVVGPAQTDILDQDEQEGESTEETDPQVAFDDGFEETMEAENEEAAA